MAKAFSVGTAGITDYKVLAKIYGTKSDAKANNNKFYACELHQGENGSTGKYRVYVDYGRIGGRSTKKEYLPGATAFTDEYSARAAFDAQVKAKFGLYRCSACGNRGPAGAEKCSCDRALNYKDYPKNHYVPVQLAQTKVGSAEAQAEVDTSKLSDKARANITVTSPQGTQAKAPTYPQGVVEFINHIHEEAGHAAMHSLNTGALKATEDNPLGTLSQSQLDTGKEVLADLTTMLNARKGKLVGTTDSLLMDLTSRFYQAIPQDIGYRPNWNTLCINEWSKHAAALDLIDLLGDVKGVQASFQGGSTTHDRIVAMGCKLGILDPGDPEWKRIAAMSTTVSSNHRGRFGKAKVRRIITVEISGQNTSWYDPDKVGNTQEMFHGSRNCNMLGITSKGLLMRPPGVVITGSMFGNGLYFSPTASPDGRSKAGCFASKSMQYAAGGWGGTRNRRSNFYLYIVDVAQGRVKCYDGAQSSLTRAPGGYDSVRGVKGYSLQHDEHIIYRLRQHRIKYIVDIDPGSRW